MKKAREKKLVYVPDDVVDEVAEVSRRRGETISKFVEDALRQAVKVDRAGFDVKRFADFFQVLQASKVLGGVFVPFEVLSHLIEKAYSSGDKKILSAKWFESGVWHGKYLKEKFEDSVSAFRLFLEACRWDLDEVEVKKTENGVKVVCVSSVLTLEATEFLAEFVAGAMSGIGFKQEKKDVVKGMLILDFKPQSSAGS